MTDLFQIAVDLADQAIPTFPCSASKSPLIPKEQGGRGFLDATLDHDPAAWKDAVLVGMATGAAFDMASGLDILDIDPRHGGDVWEAEHAAQIPTTRVVHTAGGGRHYYFRALPGLRSSVSRIATGVDVRAEGGYVVRWDAAGHMVEHGDVVAEWPGWLADIAAGPKVRHAESTTRSAADIAAPSVAAVVDLLDDMPNPDDADRDVYLRVMMAARGCGDDPAIGEAAVQWAARWIDSPGEDAESGKWERDFSLRDRPLAGWSNLLAQATRFGVDVAKYRALTPSEFGTVERVGSLPIVQTDAAPGQIMGNPNWYSKLLTNDKDAPLASIANALLAFREAPAWAGVLGYDEFANRDMFVTPPPWHIGVFVPRELEDVDHTLAAEWLHVQGIRVATGCAAEAMHAVAKASKFHPVRSYLHSLQWDGIPRLDTWLIDHLGAEDTALNRAFGSKFLISAVARVMHPGCKVDTMLVLEGDQGIGKSTALRTLAGSAWFTDHIPDLASKDAVQQLPGIWLMEHAELATLGKADANRAKEFISRRVDKYRPSYGRVAIDFPRQCVFAASVNPGGMGYLKDDTGARRFWPVQCGVGWLEGREVNTVHLAGVRDQLWAEAVECMAAGVPHWLTDRALARDQVEATDARHAEDAWTEGLCEFLALRESVTVAEACSEHLNIPRSAQNAQTLGRIAAVFNKAGWKSKQVRKPGNGGREYRYMRPESWGPVVREAAPVDMDALAA